MSDEANLTKEGNTMEDKTMDTNSVETPPVAPVVPVVPATPVPTRDFEAELLDKDNQLKSIQQEMAKVQGASEASQTERLKLQGQIGSLIAQRETIETDRDAKLKEKDASLAQVSEATQNLDKKSQELQAKLDAETAKRVKLEVLSQEFPELLKYSNYIEASSDPEHVRQLCKTFADTRDQDLSVQRQRLGGDHAMRTVPLPTNSTPSIRPINVDSIDDMEAYFSDLQSKSPNEFEAGMAAALRAFNAKFPSQ